MSNYRHNHFAASSTRCDAAQQFATGLLDVVDNLERAIESVPEEVLAQGVDPETGKPITADRALTTLRSFVDGIRLTFNIFVKVRQVLCLCMPHPAAMNSMGLDSPPTHTYWTCC